MQLRLDAADRLVELVEERRGPVVAEEAARRLFALRQAPGALARTLLADVVEADARLAWAGDAVALARPLGADLLLEDATYVVVDLETTGLRPGTCQICEIGAVKIEAFEIVDEFATLVDPRVPLGATITAITGLTDRQLRGTPVPAVAASRFLALARDLRARLRSYFRSDRQRPAVEAALGALERIEWQVLGSELEAALEELRIIRELRPPANARVARSERYVWLRARGEGVCSSASPARNAVVQGPIRSRRQAQLAARALRADELGHPALAL